MKRTLFFVFPHPDDESFVTGGTVAAYSRREDCQTALYTMTRGESSRNAALSGITPDEIAALRVEEVRRAAALLGVQSFRQGAYPDGGMRDMDPRVIEHDIRERFDELKPDVVVTYDVQGASGHSDHIVLHHVVKRVFLESRERNGYPRRLAFTAMPQSVVAKFPRKVFGFPEERIHARIRVADFAEIELGAINSHQSVIRDVQEHNYDNWMLSEYEYYSFFQERFSPPLDDLFAELPQ